MTNAQSNINSSINDNNIVVGLDIGTSKIIALVAQKSQSGNNLNILGLGISESEGLNRGVVVNIERTVNAIRKVIDQAEQQSGIKINEVVVGIAGDHIESFKSMGLVGISSPNKEISEADVRRSLDEARQVAIPSERRILHVIPQSYVIDGQDGIYDPIGMSGVRMETNVHIVTGLETAIRNIYTCVERAGLAVKDLVLEPLACSYGVLSAEEKEVGVALIDIGGGTTDIAIFEENIIRYTSVIGIAGRQVTDDIRKGVGIILAQAERVKKEFGHAFIGSIHKDEVFMIPGINGRNPIEMSKSILCNIIQPRMEEIFEFALAEIEKSGYLNKLGAGLVITGGSTLLRGSEELAQEIFRMPVKIGMPSGITYSGLGPEIENPVYSTAVGLATFGLIPPKYKVMSSDYNSNQKYNNYKDESLKEENKNEIKEEKTDTEVNKEINEINTEKVKTEKKEKQTVKSLFQRFVDFLKNL